jgi:hypothetical protein
MKTSVLFTLLLSGASSFAQLAIYNFTGTQSVVGSGIEGKVRVSGVLIVDLANDRATRIGKFAVPAGKQFAIDDEPSFTVWRAQGPKATTFLVTSSYSETNNGTLDKGHTFYSGKETMVVIGPGTNAVSLPKSVKGAGYAVIDEGGDYVSGLGTITMTHSYSQSETVGANTRGETVEQAVERWRQALLAQGYVEAEDD